MDICQLAVASKGLRSGSATVAQVRPGGYHRIVHFVPSALREPISFCHMGFPKEKRIKKTVEKELCP